MLPLEDGAATGLGAAVQVFSRLVAAPSNRGALTSRGHGKAATPLTAQVARSSAWT
jgi:hypothetical protein